MSWKDRLEPASLDGFEFLFDGHSVKGGNRLVVHEFPGADVPVVEDFGEKAIEMHMDAYFVGSDFDVRSKEFLAILRKKGVKSLVHPYFSVIGVRCKDWSITETTAEGGYCAVSLDFVPEGEAIAAARVDAVDHADDKLTGVADAAELSFLPYGMSIEEIQGFSSYVSGRLNKLQGILASARVPAIVLSDVGSMIRQINSDLFGLLSSPSSYVASLRGVFNAISSIADIGSSADDVGAGLSSYSAVRPVDKGNIVTVLTDYAVSDKIIAKRALSRVSAVSVLQPLVNKEKHKALLSVFSVVAACKIASDDYRSSADRDRALLDVKRGIAFIIPLLADDIFNVAISARKSLVDALSSQYFPSSAAVDIVGYIPAEVLAYRFNTDVDGFIATNAVKHPLFVSGAVYG